jgi:hypothetical protein
MNLQCIPLKNNTLYRLPIVKTFPRDKSYLLWVDTVTKRGLLSTIWNYATVELKVHDSFIQLPPRYTKVSLF